MGTYCSKPFCVLSQREGERKQGGVLVEGLCGDLL